MKTQEIENLAARIYDANRDKNWEIARYLLKTVSKTDRDAVEIKVRQIARDCMEANRHD